MPDYALRLSHGVPRCSAAFSGKKLELFFTELQLSRHSRRPQHDTGGLLPTVAPHASLLSSYALLCHVSGYVVVGAL